MKPTRRTQHREQREQRQSRELADLKRQNEALKRKRSRLEQEVDRLRDRGVPSREKSVQDSAPLPKQPTLPTRRCPKCGGDKASGIILPGHGAWEVCNLCGDRRKVLDGNGKPVR